MNETRTIPLTTLSLYVLWIAVAACILTSWILMLTDHTDMAILFGFSGCAFVGGAATLMIRCYMHRICGLIRSLYGLEPPAHGELHTVR